MKKGHKLLNKIMLVLVVSMVFWSCLQSNNNIPINVNHIFLDKCDSISGSDSDYDINVAIIRSAGSISPMNDTWADIEAQSVVLGDYSIKIDGISLNKKNFSYLDILQTRADVLVLSAASDPSYQLNDLEIDAIIQYIKEGHGFIMTGASMGWGVENNRKLGELIGLNASVEYNYDSYLFGDFSFSVAPSIHPIFEGISSEYNPSVDYSSAYPISANEWSDAVIGGEIIAISNTTIQSIEAAIIMNNKTWRSLYFSYDIESALYSIDDIQILYNSIVWCGKYQCKINNNDLSLRRGEQLDLNACLSDLEGVLHEIENSTIKIYIKNNTDFKLLNKTTTIYQEYDDNVSISWEINNTIPLGLCYINIILENYVIRCSLMSEISILNALPIASIITPSSDVTWQDINKLVLEANIFDYDSEQLSIVWKSDRDGIIGNQQILTDVELSFGFHIINLSVSDGQNQVSDSIVINYIDYTVFDNPEMILKIIFGILGLLVGPIVNILKKKFFPSKAKEFKKRYVK